MKEPCHAAVHAANQCMDSSIWEKAVLLISWGFFPGLAHHSIAKKILHHYKIVMKVLS